MSRFVFLKQLERLRNRFIQLTGTSKIKFNMKSKLLSQHQKKNTESVKVSED